MSDPVNPDSKPTAAPEPTPYAAAPEPTPYAAAPEPTPYAAPGANPYASGNPYAGTPAPKVAVLSLISMIVGILGVLGFLSGWGILPALAAVVLGHLGQRKEKQAKALWLTGLITGYVGIALNLLVVGAFVLAIVFGFAAMGSYQP